MEFVLFRLARFVWAGENFTEKNLLRLVGRQFGWMAGGMADWAAWGLGSV